MRLGWNSVSDEGCKQLAKIQWDHLGQLNLCKEIIKKGETISVRKDINI